MRTCDSTSTDCSPFGLGGGDDHALLKKTPMMRTPKVKKVRMMDAVGGDDEVGYAVDVDGGDQSWPYFGLVAD